MRTAECEQEVVPRNLVRKVIDLYRCRVSLVPFRLAQEIISSHARVKNIARLHAIGMVVLDLSDLILPLEESPGSWASEAVQTPENTGDLPAEKAQRGDFLSLVNEF